MQFPHLDNHAGTLTSCLSGYRQSYSTDNPASYRRAIEEINIHHIGLAIDARKHLGPDATPREILEWYRDGALFPVWEQDCQLQRRILAHLASSGFLNPLEAT